MSFITDEWLKNKNAPKPPYYCVLFYAKHREVPLNPPPISYSELSEQMRELACQQPGFLGQDVFERENGHKVSITYWTDRESIQNWKSHPGHQKAQALAVKCFYEYFVTRISLVEQENSMVF